MPLDAREDAVLRYVYRDLHVALTVVDGEDQGRAVLEWTPQWYDGG